MDLEFSPSLLETPSLMTPNIGATPLLFKSSYTADSFDVNVNDKSDTKPSALITLTTNNESSNNIKLSKIEDELKRSVIHSRKPTESPFQKMITTGIVLIDDNINIPPIIDDGMSSEMPSTAEVMNDIESFSKFPIKDNTERETVMTLTTDNSRYDASPTHNMDMIVSPKKQFLKRSQSHTEPSSPISSSNIHLTQTQKLNLDDGNLVENHFQRTQKITVDSNSQSNNSTQLSKNVNQPVINKQQQQQQQQSVIINNKRTQQQITFNIPVTKGNTNTNEVTSSDQKIHIKRQKLSPAPGTNQIVRQTFSSAVNNNNNSGSSGGDDPRRKQIRDSNREAARRCRERRRQYIEQLETNIEQCKSQIKQLTEKLSRSEQDNTRLRAILTETKIFRPTTIISSNEPIEYSSVIDLNSESTDGNLIQRNYITRNAH